MNKLIEKYKFNQDAINILQKARANVENTLYKNSIKKGRIEVKWNDEYWGTYYNAEDAALSIGMKPNTIHRLIDTGRTTKQGYKFARI